MNIQMLKDLCTKSIYKFVNNYFDLDYVYEIRMKINYKLRVNSNSIWSECEYIVTADDILDTMRNLTENAIYAHSEEIKNGFITYNGGIRVGICGDVVIENGRIITYKYINALVIRIPHLIKYCAKSLYKYLNASNKSMLIVSPPFCGKTTMIRDLARYISKTKNVVIIDEKKEISAIANGYAQLDVGSSIVLSGLDRKRGIETAIRNLSPDYIVTDEIYIEEDKYAMDRAINSGVGVVASCHGDSLKGYSNLFNVKVLLSNSPTVGTIKDVVYDENYN